MYRVVVADQSQRTDFDRFVANHPKGHVLQLWEWGEVKRAMGWLPLPVMLMDDSGIQAAILVLKRRLPIPGINKSIFYAPRGPVADVHRPELLDSLFQGIRTLARQHGAIFLKIDPDIEHDDAVFKEYLLGRGFKKTQTGDDFEGVQPTYVFRMDIGPDEDQLLENMAGKTRYNLRLAQKKGVEVRSGTKREDLKVFYDILQETAERDNFLVRNYSYFETIWEHLVQNDWAHLFLAQYEGRIIAGTLALVAGKKAWYLYGASSNRYRNVMPNYLLQWKMIIWAKSRGCTLYDFRGVSGDLSEDNPLYGLYRFKKGFGARFTEFIGEWDLVYSPFFYWLWVAVLPLYYQSVRKLIRLKRK
jgi:lipid II:glycine glycyltransferase (peptidoglycan interpeptide bridge formation enzyme)